MNRKGVHVVLKVMVPSSGRSEKQVVKYSVLQNPVTLSCSFGPVRSRVWGFRVRALKRFGPWTIEVYIC